jgi:inner membrane protein
MASLGHVAVGMAVARFRRPTAASTRALLGSMLAWSALSLLPDLDVVGLKLGVPYGAPFGHRGATHSCVFSIGLGLAIGACGARTWRGRFGLGAWASVVLLSHALLDSLTDGGLGCALLWPFEHTRYFAPWQPIPVAPIALRMLSSRGFQVAATELLMFAPLVAYALWPRRAR